MEYRFSDVACLLTGIGGDFEGGKYPIKRPFQQLSGGLFYRRNDEFITPTNGNVNKIRKNGTKGITY